MINITPQPQHPRKKKERRYAINGSVDWPPEPFSTFWGSKSHVSAGIRTPALQGLAGHYTDYAIHYTDYAIPHLI